MNITNSIERMAARTKVGAPKWNGVVTPSTSASSTALKSGIPKIAAATVPTTNPTRTATVARKRPRKNR
jgi:hypothetical protein